jgi:hypothetical protein
LYLYISFFALVKGAIGAALTSSQEKLKPERQIEKMSSLVQAIDATLEKFGDKARTQIYDYLQKRIMLRKDEIPSRPEDFSRGLFDIFGSTSKLIELSIAGSVNAKLGIKFEPKQSFRFAGYVASLRESMSRRR